MPEPTNPEDSLIRRAGKGAKKVASTNEFDWFIKLLMAAAVAAGSGYASHKVTDANDDVAIHDNRSEVLALQQSLQEARDGFRQYADVSVREEESKREADVRRLELKLTRIETILEERLHVAPMPMASPSPHP